MQSPVLERLVGGAVLLGLLVMLALVIGPRNGPRAPDPDGLERPGAQDAFVPAESGIAAAPEEDREPPAGQAIPQWVPPGSVPHAPQPARAYAAPPGARSSRPRGGQDALPPSGTEERGAPPVSPGGGQDAAPAGSGGGEWAVQLGSFAERGNAERLSDWCRERGLGVKIVSTNGDGGTRYRVRVGPYESRESARAAAAQLSRQPQGRGAFATRWNGGQP